MSNRKKSSSLKRKKRKLKEKMFGVTASVGMSPLKIFLSLLLLVGVGYLIVQVAFSGTTGQPISDSDSEITPKFDEVSITEALNKMDVNRLPAGKFMAVLEQMGKFESTLDKIEAEGEPTEKHKLDIARLRVRNQGIIVMMMMRNKIECESEKAELVARCMARLDHADPEVSETSMFWLCALQAMVFSESPSETTFTAFKEAIDMWPGGCMGNSQNAVTLSGIVVSMGKKKATNFGFARRAMRELAGKFETVDVDTIKTSDVDEIKTSEVNKIKQVAARLRGLEVFLGFDLSKLPRKIRRSNPRGLEELRGALEALGEHPETDIENWVMVIRSYESFLATDKIEETGAAWTKVSDLAEKLDESEKKAAIQVALDRQRKRVFTIGRPFDLSGKSIRDDSPIAPKKDGYTVVMFCNKNKESMNWMYDFGKANKEQRLPYNPVIALETISKEDIESLENVPSNFRVADEETSKKYFERFPVDFFPYILLLDGEGNIVAANIAVDQIPNRIATREAAKRRGLRATSEPAATTGG